MREITFRIRLKHKNAGDIETDFVTLEQLLERNGCYWGPLWEIISKEQFAGILDKNGKEVYEGDIIKYQENILGKVSIENFIVRFNSGAFYLESQEDHEYNSPITISPIEVIGNIYENENLLNKKEENNG